MFNVLKQDSHLHDSPTERNSRRDEMLKADRLSMRLLQVPDDDSDEEYEILRQSLDLSVAPGTARRHPVRRETAGT